MFTWHYRNKLAIVGGLLLFGSGWLVGCGGAKRFTFQEKLPSIAHVHIGHAMTGWKPSPDHKGLFLVAEEEARIALAQARKAVEQPENLAHIQEHVRGVMHAVDPTVQKKGPGLGFGAKKALFEAIGHITFAAKSDDASVNVQQFADPFAESAKPTMDRCDLIQALGQEIVHSSNSQDAYVLAQEVLVLASAIVEGVDLNQDGRINPDVNEIGLQQMRAQITAMIDRENPPYQTVAQRYLFGLIRMPSGKWAFSWLVNPFYDDEGGDGSGGGY